METPNNEAGRLTEKIMIAFSEFNEAKIIEVSTDQYNKIYSHIFYILESSVIEKRK